jgi:RHS repeat-associated protein
VSFRAADPRKIPIDSNGNLATKTEGSDSWGYEWNARNQLTRVTKNYVEQARFGYDPLGRRVERVAGGVATSYTYDANSILREVTGSTTLKYVHGPTIDEPLVREDGSGSFNYYHADPLGSIAKRTNQVGAVIQEYRYDAWGNIEIGATESGFAFTSREWDPDLGLAYYRARFYDSKVGRFIGEDPIKFSEGTNLYTYVGNDPVNSTDPSGLKRTYPRLPPPKLPSPNLPCTADDAVRTLVMENWGKWQEDPGNPCVYFHYALDENCQLRKVYRFRCVPPQPPRGCPEDPDEPCWACR